MGSNIQPWKKLSSKTLLNHAELKVSPAEKRIKIKVSFKNAVKKMGQTPLPKKKGN